MILIDSELEKLNVEERLSFILFSENDRTIRINLNESNIKKLEEFLQKVKASLKK